jgi:hypothetical protein
MKKILALVLFACCAGFAQTTTFTANTKDLATVLPATPEAGPVYLELTLKNCAGSGTTPTIPHVNGTGLVVFPVNLYPDGTGLISKTVYDQTFITCGSSTGVGYYHIRVYQGDNTRSLVKKLVFEDDYNVQGASFNLNSATPRSGAVISPPVATAVLTNPAGSQTIVQPAGTALSVNNLSAGFAQSANGTDMIPGQRFTDTSPTGNFLNFKTLAGVSLFSVDVLGVLHLATITGSGSVTVGTPAWAGSLNVAAQDGVNEGGELHLLGAAANTTAIIDTLGGSIRMFGGAASPVTVNLATGILNAAGFQVAGLAASGNVLRGNGTNFVSSALAFSDLTGVGTCAQEPALTGDTTSSAGSCTTTTAKVNGVSYPASPSTHAVPVTTAANTETYKVVPDCTDTTGNHLNYTQSTDVFSCGTSVPANTVTTTGAQTLTGKTYGGTTQNIQKFTASGTFTIPANITSVKFILVGGGGAGGGSTAANNGGGGGSGGYAEKYLSGLTPGNTITVTVGGGGAGVSGANGNAGTASSIASGTQTITTVTANGGGGGQTQSGNIATPGSGATVSTNGDVNGFGVNGFFSASSQIGGAGASTFLGGGGSPGTNTAGGNASANTGSGGGGAGGPGSSFAGGNGASGIVIAEWVN